MLHGGPLIARIPSTRKLFFPFAHLALLAGAAQQRPRLPLQGSNQAVGDVGDGLVEAEHLLSEGQKLGEAGGSGEERPDNKQGYLGLIHTTATKDVPLESTEVEIHTATKGGKSERVYWGVYHPGQAVQQLKPKEILEYIRPHPRNCRFSTGGGGNRRSHTDIPIRCQIRRRAGFRFPAHRCQYLGEVSDLAPFHPLQMVLRPDETVDGLRRQACKREAWRE